MSDGLLLDTCAVIRLGHFTALAPEVEATLESARDAGRLFVSPFSAWEIGTLVRRGRLNLTEDPTLWFEDFVARAGSKLLPLTPAVLVASTALPGTIHNDPADRIVIASARSQDLAIVTRDRLILDYAAQGHVKALAC